MDFLKLEIIVFIGFDISKMPAILGVIAGLLIIGLVSWAYLPVHKNLAIVLGTMAILLMGFFLGLIVKKGPKDFLESYR